MGGLRWPLRRLDPSFQGIHDAFGKACHGGIACYWIAEPFLKFALEHADLQNSDSAAWSAKTTPKVSREASKSLGQALIYAVQATVDRRDQT